MKPHHLAWLQAHPERSADWLKRMLREGFQVHHIDGDHHNNHPANLALIEHIDHLRLHGMFGLVRPSIRLASHKGGKNRWIGTTPEERSKHAKRAAMVGVLKRRRQRMASHKARKA